MKLHVLLDHDDYMPSFVSITHTKTHESRISKKLSLKPGSIVACDKRMKDNCVSAVEEVRIPPKNKHIFTDEIVHLTGTVAAKYPGPLRRITVEALEKGKYIVLLTNHLDFGASTISTIYKDRWEIELFFKTLKQNLKVKTFVGISENALRIRIWTALISLLVIKWLHRLSPQPSATSTRSKAGWSFSTMAIMLQLNLFTYRVLRAWLDQPFETPLFVPGPEQLKFEL